MLSDALELLSSYMILGVFNMFITEANIDDAQEILLLQKKAYVSEAEIYNDFLIPPLVQTLDEIKNEFEKCVFLKAVYNGQIVGSVRASLDDSKTCYIGKLIVHPDFQNQGIGTDLMNKIELFFEDCNCFELFTGHKSWQNIKLYEKLGYSRYKIEKVTDNLCFIYFRKNKISLMKGE